MASRIEPSNVAPPPYESAIADDFQKTPTAPVAIIPQTRKFFVVPKNTFKNSN